MIGQGVLFDDYTIGATYKTLGRTVSETDIVNFVNLGGLTEPLFMDMEYVAKESVFGRRAAPGVMTFALSEGLCMQTGLIHGTGMAWLGGEVKVHVKVHFSVAAPGAHRSRGGAGAARARRRTRARLRRPCGGALTRPTA